MKKSHRKDVIIARIIFAGMVLILVALIVFGVKAIAKYRAGRSPQQDSSTTESTQEGTNPDADGQESSDDGNDQWIVGDTENTQGADTENTEDAGAEGGEAEATVEGETAGESGQTYLKALYSVNIRAGAGKTYDKVGGVEVGATILLLEDMGNGWGYIQKGDLTGYVYLEYFETVDGAQE